MQFAPDASEIFDIRYTGIHGLAIPGSGSGGAWHVHAVMETARSSREGVIATRPLSRGRWHLWPGGVAPERWTRPSGATEGDAGDFADSTA